eukprot:1152685-Pelagomonas_calceolata.AAC.7
MSFRFMLVGQDSVLKHNTSSGFSIETLRKTLAPEIRQLPDDGGNRITMRWNLISQKDKRQ